MTATCSRLSLVFLLLGFVSPIHAQQGDRIWGQVRTVDGDRYEGFIRWDKNEGSWVDLLNGTKEIPEEAYENWLEATGEEQPTRVVELMGYRISWDEVDPDFPAEAGSGIRFGHLRSLTVDGSGADLVLRTGERVSLAGGSTDLGWSIRELIIEDPRQGTIELEWDELDRILFSSAPTGAMPESRRLYGTAEDVSGRTYTGFISWDLDEILESDVLDGSDEDGDDREIPFGDIQSIEGHRRESVVVLKSGETLRLRGSNDVNRRNRGIQISDPDLGMVEIEWDEFRIIRFQPLETRDYATFDGGHPLFGTLTTQDGEEIAGRITWDADEEASWEILDGEVEEVKFSIEFGKIARIQRGEDDFGAAVTLLDGRTFELSESNDVTWDNKGIFVWLEPEFQALGEVAGGSLVTPDSSLVAKDSTFTPDTIPGVSAPPSSGPDISASDRPWRYVSWDEFKEIRFDHRTRAQRVGGGA